jgi:hypothetical protein
LEIDRLQDEKRQRESIQRADLQEILEYDPKTRKVVHMASFTVRVVDDDNQGISGARVRLAFTSLTRGMTEPEYTTDSNGRADLYGYDEGEIEVFIDGRSYGKHYYRDGDEITLTK